MSRLKKAAAWLVPAGVLAATIALAPSVALGAIRGLTSENYGYSVAISGPIAVVGAPGEDHGSGTVYIFHRSGKSWRYQAKINDPGHLAQDAFGWSVAVSSTASHTYLAVGETSINGATNYVYVYTLSLGRWNLQSALEDPQNYSGSNFGFAVAITQKTLAIGTPGANNEYGVVYMYSKSGKGWLPARTLVDPGNNYDDNFGYAVAVSGGEAIIGASDISYVYTAGLGRAWTRSATLRNPSSSELNFGWNVGIDGDTAVVAAPAAHIGLSQGAAYVYTRLGGNWRIQAKLTSPGYITKDTFGQAVAVSGTRIIVGAPTGGRNNAGIVYDFRRTRSNWDQRQVIKDPTGVPGDKFGWSVSLSGAVGAIGSPGQNKGFVRTGLH
jgi:hypothetical protein